jgi:DNA-binding transcriptional LysR family regulator
MMIDARRILTFREVARQRSFSRAAVALSLTQPAVSQHIRALETQLGTRLIERGRAGFALTPAGELLMTHAEALFERLQLAEAQLGEAIGESQRVFRVGAFASALGILVPRALADLDHVAGPLNISALQGGTDEVVAGVRDGRLHVALCFQDAGEARREHAGARRLDLWDEPMLAAVGPAHSLAKRRRIRLAELATDPWLVGVRGGLIERACLAAGFEPRVAYLTEDPTAIKGIIEANLSVTLTSQMLAGEFRGVPTLTLSGEQVRRAVYAVVPSAAVHPLVEPFLDSVRAWPGAG